MSVTVPNPETSTLGRDLARAFRSPGVITVLVVLLLAAVLLNGAVGTLKLQFRKDPVALRKPLTAIPIRVGAWYAIDDRSLPPEQEHALGTKDYINRIYVDTRVVPESLISELSSTPEKDRQPIRNRIFQAAGRSVISVHLAYYTGLVDTVAHVPERCMTGGGFDIDPDTTAAIDLNVPNLSGKSDTLKMKYIEFQKREAGSAKQNVAYTFNVNGKYVHDSTGVRTTLQNLREKHAYYCKIELMTFMNNDSKAAQSMMEDFLSAALPGAESCLPDWEAVKASESK